jgi:hypothetical protein
MCRFRAPFTRLLPLKMLRTKADGLGYVRRVLRVECHGPLHRSRHRGENLDFPSIDWVVQYCRRTQVTFRTESAELHASSRVRLLSWSPVSQPMVLPKPWASSSSWCVHGSFLCVAQRILCGTFHLGLT